MIPAGRVWLRGSLICQVATDPDEDALQCVRTFARGTRQSGWCWADAAQVELWWKQRDQWAPMVVESTGAGVQMVLFPGVAS